MITIVKQSAPACILTPLLPPHATELVVIGGPEIDAVLEQIKINGQLQPVTALLVPQTDTLLRAAVGIAEGHFIALIIKPQDMPSDIQGKGALQ